MKLLKGLTVAFIVTLVLNCVGVNAANYLVMNEIPIPVKRGETAQVTGKNENSIQYVKIKNSHAANSTSLRNVQASLLGKDVFGDSCATTYKNLSKNNWVTLGNATTDGCGTFPQNGNGLLKLRTVSSYTDTTFFWGTWITTTTLYNQSKDIL